MPREIPLTRGLVAVVDDEDFEWLSQWKWYAGKSHRRGHSHWYAHRNRTSAEGEGPHTIAMHRLIIGAPDHLQVDHWDRDGLNNRRANLRLATPTQNQQNSRSRRGSSSQFKGVLFISGRQLARPWRAWIKVAGRMVHLGYFSIEAEAALAYNAAAADAFGDFAHLNVIPPKDTADECKRVAEHQGRAVRAA